jgi:hypothetical protein
MLLQFAGVESEPYALSREDHADDRLAVIRARIRASRDDPRRDLTLAEVDAHIATLVAKAERVERVQRLRVEFRPSASERKCPGGHVPSTPGSEQTAAIPARQLCATNRHKVELNRTADLPFSVKGSRDLAAD